MFSKFSSVGITNAHGKLHATEFVFLSKPVYTPFFVVVTALYGNFTPLRQVLISDVETSTVYYFARLLIKSY